MERERERERERKRERGGGGYKVSLFVEHPSNIQSVSQVQIRLVQYSHAATLRQKLQIKLAIPSSHSMLTLVQPVLALTQWRHVSGIATMMSTLLSLA